MPGCHITDHQMRLYMKHRQTYKPAIPAARASISTASGYQLANDSTVNAD